MRRDVTLVSLPGMLTAREVSKAATALLHDRHITRIGSAAEADAFLAQDAALAKVLLFTDKRAPTTLYKGLSCRFRGRLLFGEVHRDVDAVVARYGVEAFPTLLVVKVRQTWPRAQCQIQCWYYASVKSALYQLLIIVLSSHQYNIASGRYGHKMSKVHTCTYQQAFVQLGVQNDSSIQHHKGELKGLPLNQFLQSFAAEAAPPAAGDSTSAASAGAGMKDSASNSGIRAINILPELCLAELSEADEQEPMKLVAFYASQGAPQGGVAMAIVCMQHKQYTRTTPGSMCAVAKSRLVGTTEVVSCCRLAFLFIKPISWLPSS